MARMLDDTLLAEYDAMLEAQRVIPPDTRPGGLTDAQIDEIAGPLGLRLPEEARRWYRWHNGSRWDLFDGRAQLSLTEAVERSLDSRSYDENWRHGWLQATNEQPQLLFQCDGSFDAPVPVWHYDYEPPGRPRYESIGEMLSYWMSLVDSGQAFRRDGLWKLREPVPADVRFMLGGVPSD